jgi:hypothetical protein
MIGCYLKQIFDEISDFCNTFNVSFDTGHRWKKEICFWVIHSNRNISNVKEIVKRDARYTFGILHDWFEWFEWLVFHYQNVHYILKHILNYRRISCRWVPYFLMTTKSSKRL